MSAVVAKNFILNFLKLAEQFCNELLDSSFHCPNINVQPAPMVKSDIVCFLSHLKLRRIRRT